MNDQHVDDIIAIGPKVTEKIWEFIFSSIDVSYEARCGMSQVTSDALIRRAKACPNLKKVTLQDASGLSDECLVAFIRCSKLTHLEILGPKFTGDAFDTLQGDPNLAPKLKKISVSGPTLASSGKDFIRSMRDMSRFRPKLIVELVERSPEKKWGDWELVESRTSLKNGREQKWNPYKDASLAPNDFGPYKRGGRRRGWY